MWTDTNTDENTDTNTVTKDLVTVLAVAAAHQKFKRTNIQMKIPKKDANTVTNSNDITDKNTDDNADKNTVTKDLVAVLPVAATHKDFIPRNIQIEIPNTGAIAETNTDIDVDRYKYR